MYVDQFTACTSAYSTYISGLYDETASRARYDICSALARYAIVHTSTADQVERLGYISESHSPTRRDAHCAKCLWLNPSLDEGSGLETLIGAAFGGGSNIMGQGKPRVRAMRASRMVSSILLQSFKSWKLICEYLEKARLHPTGRHWVDNLITPTLLAHQLLRSEREGDWLLQQMCIKRLLSYFIAGHHHYARYLSWHCFNMSMLLPDDAKEDTMAGAFVCRHKAGWWNSVSSDDQFGKQTAIKIGTGGLKGISLSSAHVAEWINSFPISAYITDTLDHCDSPN